ncbi:Nitrogen assimilation transcription factor nirA [Colletotrichum fructicola]|nr:Nitrogen assimilation transcription factor nirA [Colletotrichum fructicola]KAF4914465.1 Nitrogen assimilation transcription factor nirA [Colletotrichum fructicola]KAF4940818.1 Nitrogen assimilation transcription factor nirA [Colletotrichum fructicola]
MRFRSWASVVVISTFAHPSSAHMMMSDPPPLKAKINPNTAEGNVEYSYTNPLSSSGSDYPCKGHLSVLGTSEADPVATWNAGEDHTITLSGHTTHNGGSCQVSMSLDGGNTFKVLRSVIGGCPAGDGYQISFTLPDDTPSSDQAILAWSWFNNLGNREMYMNCAVIKIGNGGSGNNFRAQPDIFRANVGNGCRTVDNADVMIPNPGSNVELVSSNAVPPTGDCESGPGAQEPGGSDSNSGSGSSSGLMFLVFTGQAPTPQTNTLPTVTWLRAIRPGCALISSRHDSVYRIYFKPSNSCFGGMNEQQRKQPLKNMQPLRPLLPAQDSAAEPAKFDNLPRKRPRPVQAACNACRKRKSRCTGERPTCSVCLYRRSSCEYTTRPGESRQQATSRKHNEVQGRATIHEQVLALLKNLPEEAAQDVFQRIRSGADAATIVNHVEAGDLLLQMAVAPETRLRYNFPYRSEMPEIYVQNNPYLNSFIYEAASLYPAHGQGRPSHATAGGSQELQSVYTKPFHAARVVEPRLSDAKISWWTNVCDDDSLMRDLLRALFRCEYQFSAAFQKDLFLEDLVAQKQDFCSSLLVNITLAYACVCYQQFSNRVEYWNPNTLGYRFLAEAKRLWELQASEPRLTTIQAGILFSVFHNLCGLDELGQPYRIHSVTLARRLRLFSKSSCGNNDSKRKGWAYTAWALYNWETLVSFSFMIPPLVKEPPDWPLPDPTREGGWYGEIWLQYPLVPGLQPTHFGHIFRTRAKFRVIMNEYCDAAFSPNGVISLDKANRLHEKLRRWYSDLPEPLKPKTIALPGHFQLHIYYYHLLLMIYEPLLAASKGRDATLQKVVADAKKYLQTLIRLYYLRHGYEAMDLFLVIPLMLTGYDCINAISEEKSEHQIEILRSTLILVAKGLQNQRRNHYLAEALFRVIRGRMRPQEVALLRSSMTFDDDQEMEKHDMVQAVRSHWPVSIVKKQEEVDDHILTHLVESYGSLNLEETAR